MSSRVGMSARHNNEIEDHHHICPEESLPAPKDDETIRDADTQAEPTLRGELFSEQYTLDVLVLRSPSTVV